MAGAPSLSHCLRAIHIQERRVWPPYHVPIIPLIFWSFYYLNFSDPAAYTDFLHRPLYMCGDPYETTDSVFGVKESLVLDFLKGGGHRRASGEVWSVTKIVPLKHDFVCITKGISHQMRQKVAQDQANRQGGGEAQGRGWSSDTGGILIEYRD